MRSIGYIEMNFLQLTGFCLTEIEFCRTLNTVMAFWKADLPRIAHGIEPCCNVYIRLKLSYVEFRSERTMG
jgi:hypothetical protein